MLSSRYLTAFCEATPAKLEPGFLIILKNNEVVGKTFFQISTFNAVKSLQLDQGRANKNFLDASFLPMKKLIARLIHLKVLVIGNLCGTGPYGFDFSEGVSLQERTEVLRLFIEKFQALNPDLKLVLLKEFSHRHRLQFSSDTGSAHFHEFEVQPSMIFYINPHWKHLQDYLNDLQSKYRLRIRKALEQGKNLRHQELSLRDLEQHLAQINSLYSQLVNKVDFNLVELNKAYFKSLKSQMGQHFRIFGFFSGNQLTGFYSTIHNGDELIAHFLGVNETDNEKYHLYFNILIRLVEQAIEGRYSKLNLARTALEIKSSIGAKPERLYFYLKHSNPLVHALIPLVLRWLKPSYHWIERNPFKKNLKQGFIPKHR